MNTLKIRMDSTNIDIEALRTAGEIIRAGGLVAFPTETVYGLGGDALNPESSRKIYAAKGRPSDNPLIVHIYRMEDLYAVASEVSDAAVKLAKAYWPGPLTMIFKKKDTVPRETTGGLDTVAVRMPSDIIAAAFIETAGGFIAAPSANLSGRPSPTDAKHVIEDMDGRIDMIIDGGPCVIGLESTIADMTGEVPMILRPGYITDVMIKETVGDVNFDPAVFAMPSEDVRPKAPGMKYRHYAPKGDMMIVRGSRDKVISYISGRIEDDANNGRKAAVIASDETKDRYPDAASIISVGLRDDEDLIARHLYAALRECDDENIDSIYSEDFDTPRIGQAIMNRLIRAAGHKIFEV